MTREHRDFARIYYREFRRDYPDIYADDRAWAAWTKMLIASEESWPAMPEIPRSVGASALQKLVGRGLVTVTGPTFALKGWVSERTMRAQNASNAAALRWHGDGNASTRTSTSKGERDNYPVEKAARPHLVDPAS